MKTIYILTFFLIFNKLGHSQIINSLVDNAQGDFPNIYLYNGNAQTLIPNEHRAGIWLDNDGKLKFRSVTGNGFAFRSTSNTHDLAVLLESGNLGLGTVIPRAKLDVGYHQSNGSLSSVLSRQSEGDNVSDGTFLGVRAYYTQPSQTVSFPNIKSFALEHSFYGTTNSSINFFRGLGITGGFISFTTNDNTEKMRLTTDGNLGINTSNPDEKLTVKGKIHAEEVKVDLNVLGPDYVFEKDYQLTPLSEIQKYIQENKHLPEVPSAKEMEKNGINLSEMNMLLLKKVEELTLHLIEKDKQIQYLLERDKQIKGFKKIIY